MGNGTWRYFWPCSDVTAEGAVVANLLIDTLVVVNVRSAVCLPGSQKHQLSRHGCCGFGHFIQTLLKVAISSQADGMLCRDTSPTCVVACVVWPRR